MVGRGTGKPETVLLRAATPSASLWRPMAGDGETQFDCFTVTLFQAYMVEGEGKWEI